MIVDLLRNDISLISEVGTLDVPELFRIESYPTVHQMVSRVRARLLPGLTLQRLLAALFPCGSITGAPKIRAMEILAGLEIAPRDAYCGAIGWIEPGGRMRFNVAIRTITLFPDGEAVYNVGGGVVFDSTAEEEYAECLLKARFATGTAARFELIETLRFDPAAGFVRGERHLARLARSAQALGFAFDAAEAWRAMVAAVAPEAHAAGPPDAGGGRHAGLHGSRLRAGRPALHRRRRGDPAGVLRPAAAPQDLAARRLRAGARRIPRRRGDEVLLLNERDELCEGTFTNLFLPLPADGGWRRRALSCGLLPGILRGGAHRRRHGLRGPVDCRRS